MSKKLIAALCALLLTVALFSCSATPADRLLQSLDLNKAYLTRIGEKIDNTFAEDGDGEYISLNVQTYFIEEVSSAVEGKLTDKYLDDSGFYVVETNPESEIADCSVKVTYSVSEDGLSAIYNHYYDYTGSADKLFYAEYTRIGDELFYFCAYPDSITENKMYVFFMRSSENTVQLYRFGYESSDQSVIASDWRITLAGAESVDFDGYVETHNDNIETFVRATSQSASYRVSPDASPRLVVIK